MSTPAIDARGLTKVYRSYATPWLRVRELVAGGHHHQEIRALDDVTFRLERGHGLAVVGENGAGKSTLLKILAGITTPSSGFLQVDGTIASILELGSGFHPELTGRQNITLNAAMLGLSERDVEEKTPGIIAFSELGSFIDQPVKTYSTGMSMRLGFAIATEVDPQILIIDEALSVGDGYFQKKCMDRMGKFVAAGGTLLFCSHAMYYVSHFCDRALWLRDGGVEALGPVDEVVREYESFLSLKGRPEAEVDSTASAAVDGERVEAPSRPMKVTDLRLVPDRSGVDGSGGPAVYRTGEEMVLEVAVSADSPDVPLHLGLGVNREDGVEVAAFSTHRDGRPPLSGDTSYRLRLALPSLPLVKGEFTLYAFLLDETGLHVYDERIVPSAFRVENPEYRFGLVDVEHAWEDVEADAGAADSAEPQRPPVARPVEATTAH